jgi:hypothetical protein
MGTINAIKLTITSHLFNQSIGILGNRIKKIPPTLIYNLNDRTVHKSNNNRFKNIMVYFQLFRVLHDGRDTKNILFVNLCK